MAEPTKADLQAENESLREEVARLNDLDKKHREETPTGDLFYERELEKRNREIEILQSNLNGIKAKEKQKSYENSVKAADDSRVKDEASRIIKQVNGGTRFTLVDRPSRYPHINVDRTADGPTFDLGVDFNNYDGSVFVPAWMVIEMGRSIGMLSEEESTAIKNQLAESEKKNHEAAVYAGTLVASVNSAVDTFNSNLANVSVGDIPSEESTGNNGEELDESSGETSEDHGQADDSNSESESAGVSADAGNADDESDDGDGDDYSDIEREFNL